MAHNDALDKAAGDFGKTARAKLGEGGQPEAIDHFPREPFKLARAPRQ